MQTKTSGEDNNSSNSPTQPLTSTSILGVKLYAFILICISLFLFLLVLVFFFIRKIKQSHGALVKQSSGIIPLVLKDVKSLDDDGRKTSNTKKMGDMMGVEKREGQEVGILKGERKKSGESDRSSSWGSKASARSSAVSVEFQNIGWGRWYSLKELEIATCGFSDENVIGEGGHGIVYRGVLDDGSVVAVKNLLNNKGQAEKEFKVEVEAIGKVRHKYLVGLVGYCAEGAQRMLVYEYADNGNLEQWLHGDVGPVSPMTWDIRMKIAIGVAKGLAYLHDGLEPKVVHRDVKSSNILLDKNWNPKVSDFGLAKLLGSGASYVTTRVMGTFGYVSPEYASTGMLSEESDVYSFGVLLMELITGRSPIDHSKPPGERNLVDWYKGMIASHRGEDVVDSLIEVHPSPRALKRALLVCLRCIDLDATKRPKMGQIVHMLEADKFPFSTEHRSAHEVAGLPHVSTPGNELQRPPDDHVVSDEQRARWR
ncbi:hypothetical protein Nepgr_018094 [Nepenthes gracilis]|uniref:non-specific serine/threonine protein kinase n=1 Tax=Nepenthes gracilis TaxID=150966 RepID=A0AAD3SRN2_NEPGR|nr:hypothetical protein Nepgr_018094 [Nepenthes gracilis]